MFATEWPEKRRHPRLLLTSVQSILGKPLIFENRNGIVVACDEPGCLAISEFHREDRLLGSDVRIKRIRIGLGSAILKCQLDSWHPLQMLRPLPLGLEYRPGQLTADGNLIDPRKPVIEPRPLNMWWPVRHRQRFAFSSALADNKDAAPWKIALGLHDNADMH